MKSNIELYSVLLELFTAVTKLTEGIGGIRQFEFVKGKEIKFSIFTWTTYLFSDGHIPHIEDDEHYLQELYSQIEDAWPVLWIPVHGNFESFRDALEAPYSVKS